MSPLELSQTDAYKDIFLITESVLNLLSQAKLVKENETEILSETGFEPPISTKTVKFADDTQRTGSMSRIKVPEKDLKFYSDFIAYTIQCLFVAEKWESMVDLADTANKQLLTVCPDLDETMSFLSLYLYQFRIYGENKLYTSASQQTDKVKQDLAVRVAKFNQWKATSKKSKSRTAMLTGEVPKEELQFRKEKAELENEIFRLEVHETILKSDKSQSEQERTKIKKSSNNIIEELRQSRKLYKKYGIESSKSKFDLKLPGDISKFSGGRKVDKSLISFPVMKYTKVIEKIRKKKEKFLLIQSLHEIGNLYFSDDQLDNAEVQWNDCVDAIFQKDVGIIKTYRALFKEIPNLAATYGSIQCVIGGVVLAKLAKLIYNNDIHLQRECVLMGSELFHAPFKVSMFHPHNKIDFADYRMKEFLPDSDLIGDKQVLLPSDLLSGLEIMCEMLLDYGLYERILPCTTIMNYVATDIVKSMPYMVKAKALKGIALCNLGYISESLNLFHQIIDDKDQVINVINPSEFMKQTKGSTFKFSDPLKSYRNDLPPESEENVQSIEHLIDTEVDICERYKISPLLESLVIYLKSSIILSTLHDPYDLSETEDLRSKYFTVAEEGFRQALQNAQNEEEVITCKVKIDFIRNQTENNPRIVNYMKFCQRKIKKIIDYEPEEGQEEEDPKSKYDYLDDEIPHSYRRSCRLSWIIRCKSVLAKLNQKKGNLLEAFYITRENLFEISKMTMPIGKFNKPPQPLPEEKFEIPEGATSAAAPGKKGGKEEKKPDPKKDKGKGKDEDVDLEETDRLFSLEDERTWDEINPTYGDKSELPSTYMWTLIKHQLIDLLFQQARYDEVAAQIQVAKQECEFMNDTYFIRLYYEMLTYIKIQRGEIEGGMSMFEGLKSYAEKFGHDDVKLAQFYANLAEFFYSTKPERCIEMFKESRVLLWINLQNRGMKVVDVNDYIDIENGSVKKEKIPEPEKKVEEEPVEEKKDPKQKNKADPKGEVPAEPDFSNIDKVLTYEKEMNHEIFLIDSSESERLFKNPNLYLLELDNLIKVNIRFAQALSTLDTKYDLALKVLADTLRMMERCLYLNPYHKYMANFLIGYCNKMLFLGKIKDFQKRYGAAHEGRGRSKYHNFIEGVPEAGLAPGYLFQDLPNFSNNIKNGWKDLLLRAKEHLEKALEVSKKECVFGEFKLDLSDNVYNLSEVCFLLSEFRESTKKYKYLDHKKIYLERGGVNPQQPDDEPENVEEMFDKWEKHQLEVDKLDILNLRNQAREYYKIGNELFKARNELEENYHLIIQTNLTDPSKIPEEIIHDVFESQSINSLSFLKGVEESMELDLWEALKSKTLEKIDSGEVISCYKSIIDELQYFTFGNERRAKCLNLIHRYLLLNLAPYVSK